MLRNSRNHLHLFLQLCKYILQPQVYKVRDKFDNISCLISNKIHHSQKESEQDNEGWVTISLVMFPEADLIKVIRGIGSHCVKNIEPDTVKRCVEKL